MMTCLFFLSRKTKKLIDMFRFWMGISSDIAIIPTATLMQRIFFIWNLMMVLISLILPNISSWWARSFKPGPTRHKLCLIQSSKSRFQSCTIIEPWFDQGLKSKKSIVLFSSFLINSLFLLSFLRSLAGICVITLDSDSAMWATSPITQIYCVCFGMFDYLTISNEHLPF